MELIETGRFEEGPALLSLKVKEQDIKALKPRTIADAFLIETPTLATIKKYQSEIVCNSAIHNLLYWLNDNLSLNNSLTDHQIETLQEMIYEDFNYLTLADLKLAFKNALKGFYGKIFGRIDTQTVMEWLYQYSSDRAIFAAEKSVEAHKQADTPVNPDSKVSGRIIKEFREKLKRDTLRSIVEEKAKTSFQYDTLEKYCNAKGHEPETFLSDLTLRWKEEYQQNMENETVSFDLFCAFKSSEFLLLENKKALSASAIK